MDPHVAPHLQALEDLHGQIVEAVAPLSDDGINRRVPGLKNTAGILLRHIAGSERYWIGEIVGGQPARRDRDAEFGGDRVQKAALLAELERVRALTRQVLGGLSAADLLTEIDVRRSSGPARATRAFALLHAAQHVAYHLGQLRYLVRLVQTAAD